METYLTPSAASGNLSRWRKVLCCTEIVTSPTVGCNILSPASLSFILVIDRFDLEKCFWHSFNMSCQTIASSFLSQCSAALMTHHRQLYCQYILIVSGPLIQLLTLLNLLSFVCWFLTAGIEALHWETNSFYFLVTFLWVKLAHKWNRTGSLIWQC